MQKSHDVSKGYQLTYSSLNQVDEMVLPFSADVVLMRHGVLVLFLDVSFHRSLLWLLLHVFFVVLRLEFDDQYHDFVVVTISSYVLIVVVAISVLSFSIVLENVVNVTLRLLLSFV